MVNRKAFIITSLPLLCFLSFYAIHLQVSTSLRRAFLLAFSFPSFLQIWGSTKRYVSLLRNKIDQFDALHSFEIEALLSTLRRSFAQRARFVLPSFHRVVELAKSYGLSVMLHSCGAIAKIIPSLIDIGVDALHPEKIKAKGMGVEHLARNFRGSLTFVGGVDTQELLPYVTPQEIKKEAHRLKRLFGERYTVSHGHEAVFANVPFKNLQTMAEAALE